MIGQACALFDKVQRHIPVKVAINGRGLGERRGLGEQLKGQAMTGIVRIEQITRIRQKFTTILGHPIVIDRVKFVHPGLCFFGVKHRGIWGHTDLSATQFACNVHHGVQVVQRMATAGKQQGLVGHH